MLETDQLEGLWANLSEDLKAGIEEGLNDIEQGRVVPHNEVWEKYGKWLSK